MKSLLFTEFQSTLIGLGAVALLVLAILLFMKWESKRATTIYEKRMKKK